MKKPAFLLLGIIFLAFHSAYAQSPLKFRYQSNPAYSVHNYKQPDKALVARQMNLNPVNVVEFREITTERGVFAQNYKNQIQTQRTTEPSKPISTNAGKQTGIQSRANYKRQF
jgi:hypothetical protein